MVMAVLALHRVRSPQRRDTFAGQDRRDFASRRAVTKPVDAEKPPERSATIIDRVVLSCDDGCHWMLCGQDAIVREFACFEEALDGARRSHSSGTGTVEIWQSGEYICCLPLNKWQPNDPLHGSGLRGPARTATERYANRVAEIIFATAGPLFWLALVFVAVAASLGWRWLL